MNRKKITKILITGFIALLACAILLPMVVNAGKQVERPFKIKSQGIQYLYTYPIKSFDSGTCTHGGQFTNEGEWWFEDGDLVGKGIATVANGDQRFWTAKEGRVTLEGGTGKYENCTGWFDYVTITEPSEDENGPIFIYSYTGEGTLTY